MRQLLGGLARLGSGDIRQRWTQFLDVIHAQCGDHRAGRLFDDIGGIQRAAKPHLQHHDIALLLRKIEHSQCGDDLELGGHVLHSVGGGLYLLHQFHQRLVRDLLAVYLNALVESVDKGRGIQAHPVTRRLQAGGQHGRRAALAVGARNGKDRTGEGNAQPLNHGLHACEPHVNGLFV